MTTLPSGQTVGISSERARYHATRQGIRVTPETSHEQLYPLIDILYADEPEAHPGASSHYRFTGHTLGEKRWLKKWKPEDREAFLQWVTEDRQVREIEGARAKIIYDTLPHEVVSHDTPQRLYSILRRRVLAMSMERAPAAQWRSTILNMAKCGVRTEEMNWSGVLDFLDDEGAKREEPIQREEILARIDFANIRIELTNELVRDEQRPLPYEELAERIPPETLDAAGIPLEEGGYGVLRYRDRLLGYGVGFVKGEGALARWFVIDPYDRVLGDETGAPRWFGDGGDARVAATEHARVRYGLKSTLRPSDKYEYMSLHGGEAYREWLVTLPDYQISHFTPHFTERNVLLHFRTKSREDLEGNRLLFIEEIQSDWHQRASRRGANSQWRERIPEAPFHKEWSLLALKLLLLHAVDEGYEAISWAPGALQQMRFQCDKKPLKRLYDKEIGHHLQQLGKPWSGAVESTRIATREPWISAHRAGEFWGVSDKEGRFSTRLRFTKGEALILCELHSRRVELDVPLFRIPEGMREKIAVEGLPLFGETLIDKVKRPLCGEPGFKGCDPATHAACTGG